ncbi:MAG: hypothetical protein Terrestrivirus8_8 [Terrestrivirus sp.]|uniref:Uncharacterized protein n=1 Tax=Terrestrivirus sp. TaxID=2487775 RepID=A0A3G4ZNR6_9VIRU|nr:MAG: hypothetical protein Terrestrivirus8_8 [Terrestrivirus sp.]
MASMMNKFKDFLFKEDRKLKLKMFWIIENNDAEGLTELCKQLKTNNADIGLYFMESWKTIFTKEESEKIKVDMCGVMDFSPLQHACNIKWYDGVKILIDYNIGGMQGCGLSIVNVDKFKEYYNANNTN